MVDDASNILDVFLVPGFFGFTHLGDVQYWSHVRNVLGPELEDRGLAARIHFVDSPPTASLTTRVAHLAQRIDELGSGGQVHLVGHSSGGLDARLLVTDATQPDRDIRSVITVATPHHGTPLAGLFASVGGQHILRLLSLTTIVVLKSGRLPLALAAHLSKALLAPADSVIEQVADQILGEFSKERRDAIAAFFDEVRRDQSLLAQITPEAMQVLHATLPAPPEGVAYGCVVTRARHPRLRTIAELGLDPYAQTMHTVFRWFHSRAPLKAVPDDGFVFPAHAFPGEDPPDLDDSDAIVPTLSQVWGELIHSCWSDHLDVIGHYDGTDDEPPHYDWIPSASNFDRHRFTAVWQDIAEFIARSAAQ